MSPPLQNTNGGAGYQLGTGLVSVQVLESVESDYSLDQDLACCCETWILFQPHGISQSDGISQFNFSA